MLLFSSEYRYIYLSKGERSPPCSCNYSPAIDLASRPSYKRNARSASVPMCCTFMHAALCTLFTNLMFTILYRRSRSVRRRRQKCSMRSPSHGPANGGRRAVIRARFSYEESIPTVTVVPCVHRVRHAAETFTSARCFAHARRGSTICRLHRAAHQCHARR